MPDALAPWIENLAPHGPFVVVADVVTLHDRIETARLALAQLLAVGESGCIGYGPEPEYIHCDVCEEAITEPDDPITFGVCAKCWAEHLNDEEAN